MASSVQQTRKTTRQRMTEILHKLKNDWIPTEFVFPTYGGPRSLAGYEIQNSSAEKAYRKWRQEYQQIQYLKRMRWVKTKKTERGLLMVLTNVGKTEQIRRSATERPKLPSGHVCLVMFDVPNDARVGRNHFRRFLKRLGFTMVQLSVWQSDRDLFKDVLDFIKEAKIQRWTEVYLAEKKS